MTTLTELDDSTFEERVIASKRPVVVDFNAPWCTPCRMLGPILERVAAKFGDKADFFSMNTDDNPSTASGLGIMNIPTVMFFKDGEEVHRIIGVHSESSYERALDALS